MGQISWPILFADASDDLGLLLAALCGRTVYVLVEFVVIGWCAIVFPELRAGDQNGCGLWSHPVRRVRLRIANSDLGFEHAVAFPPPALGYGHFIGMVPTAVWLTGVKPGPIVEPITFHNESVTFPVPNAPPVPAVLWRF